MFNTKSILLSFYCVLCDVSSGLGIIIMTTPKTVRVLLLSLMGEVGGRLLTGAYTWGIYLGHIPGAYTWGIYLGHIPAAYTCLSTCSTKEHAFQSYPPSLTSKKLVLAIRFCIPLAHFRVR